MTRILRLLTLAVGTAALLGTTAGIAAAQVSIEPTVTPTENNSGLGPLGPLPSIAVIFTAAAGIIVLLIVVGYMRYAPRFARDEESARVVRADRVLPGREAPRRTVDLSQAVPVVVQPPAIPAAVGAGAAADAGPPPARAPATAGVAASPPAPTSAPAQGGAPGEAPAQPTTRDTPAAEAAPAAEATPAAAAAPAAAAPAESGPQPVASAPPAAPPAATEERPDVSLDQETFESTLADLLAQGTDRRIAEGKARRAAMLAARKKAAGGA